MRKKETQEKRRGKKRLCSLPPTWHNCRGALPIGFGLPDIETNDAPYAFKHSHPVPSCLQSSGLLAIPRRLRAKAASSPPSRCCRPCAYRLLAATKPKPRAKTQKPCAARRHLSRPTDSLTLGGRILRQVHEHLQSVCCFDAPMHRATLFSYTADKLSPPSPVAKALPS